MVNEVKSHKIKILSWDLENRPLSYAGFDRTTAEITAIACSWIDQKKVHCWVLGQTSALDMIESFLEFYNKADMVTGHYMRKHDMPILSGACIELGLPPLSSKVVSDTCLDLVRKKDLSASQESLAGMYGLPEAKHHMSQTEWREANRLTARGVTLTKKRVVDDVIQHKALRERLIEARALKSPKLWNP